MKRIIPINKEPGYEWDEKELFVEIDLNNKIKK